MTTRPLITVSYACYRKVQNHVYPLRARADWKAGSQNSNNSYPAGCSYGNQTGICFDERAANAKRAYHEWMP
jgi:phosphodiesterase/alkaline phosphatase D-like protein